MINPMDLTNKHIVITGASSGIGRATCIQASKLGAKISMIARNRDKLNETMSLMDGKDHKCYSFDLNNIDDIESLIKSIVEEQGYIDGLVHCAGLGANIPIKLTKYNHVEELMKINYFAFVELIRVSSSKKMSNDNASFVGVSSVAATNGEKSQGAYAGTKGAMNAVVHSFAKELSPRKIRVNTIAFSMVETEMYTDFVKSGCNIDLLNKQFCGIIPPEYAANAICFLLSDISKYITGGTLNYDAGLLS